MAREMRLGQLAGLTFSAEPSALITSLVLWALLGTLAATLLPLSLPEAIVGSFLAMLLHWLSETLHQLGHARAARLTGHPMIGVRFWGPFGASIYPADEGTLPAAVHIRRALGGPPVSLLLSIIGLLLTLVLRPFGGLPFWLSLFFLLENFFVFTLGSFLPLGFTDGSTLLYWWNKQ